MPRFARQQAPGALVHVIARFVNHEFRLQGPAERALFLESLGSRIARTDWRLHAYALMSSHVHLFLAEEVLRVINRPFGATPVLPA